MDKKEIIGNIIKIIDEYQVIVDLGKNDIAPDDILYVYSKDNEIKDLNGKILGKYDICKAQLYIDKIFDNFSVCRGASEKDSRYSRLLSYYNSLALSPLLESSPKVQKLNIDSNTLNKIKTIDNAIRLGDIVKNF